MRNNWNLMSLKKEAKKYTKRSDMKYKNTGAYKAACNLGVLDIIFPHCPPRKLITPFLTKKIVLKEALKYKRKIEFSRKAQLHYNYAMKNGFLKEATKHMFQIGEKGRIPAKKWTIKNLKKEAKKYVKRSHFFKEKPGAYEAAVKLGILDKICAHMYYGNKKKWNLKSLKKEALKYRNKKEFAKKNSGAIRMAYEYGLIDKICSHMPSFEDQVRKFPKEEVLKEAKKYKTRIEFITFSPGAYFAAKKNKWLDESCKHMVYLQRRIEEKMLHPKIIKILKKNGFKENKTFFYHQKINNQIPDFIILYKNYVLIIEAKTCATHINRNVYTEYENQIKLQRKEVFKKYNKKTFSILVSEFGSIKLKSTDYNLSLKSLDKFFNILHSKKIILINKNFSKKEDDISRKKLNQLSFKIIKKFEEKYDSLTKTNKEGTRLCQK